MVGLEQDLPGTEGNNREFTESPIDSGLKKPQSYDYEMDENRQTKSISDWTQLVTEKELEPEIGLFDLKKKISGSQRETSFQNIGDEFYKPEKELKLKRGLFGFKNEKSEYQSERSTITFQNEGDGILKPKKKLEPKIGLFGFKNEKYIWP